MTTTPGREVAMLRRRTSFAALTAALALAAPAQAMPIDHVAPAPINARGTDVAAPDQQVRTDYAAAPEAPATSDGDSSPAITLAAVLALAIGGFAFASRITIRRRRPLTP